MFVGCLTSSNKYVMHYPVTSTQTITTDTNHPLNKQHLKKKKKHLSDYKVYNDPWLFQSLYGTIKTLIQWLE
jgi:hypothetical protein